MSKRNKLIIILAVLFIAALFLFPKLYPVNMPLITIANKKSASHNRSLIDKVEKEFGQLYINEFIDDGCSKEPGRNKSPYKELRCESYQYAFVQTDSENANNTLVKMYDFMIDEGGFSPAKWQRKAYLSGVQYLTAVIITREDINECVDRQNSLSICEKPLPPGSGRNFLNDKLESVVGFKITNTYYIAAPIICLTVCP